MVDRLKPEFGPDDICLATGDGSNIVLFVDYADRTGRRVRDIFRRSLSRLQDLNPTVAVRFFIADSQNKNAEIAVRAAIAAHRQDRFSDMHNALHDVEPDTYSEDLIVELAERIGLDTIRFKADLYANETTEKIVSDNHSAQQSLSYPHVPMLFIQGRFYNGVWDDEAVLEAMEQPFGVRIETAGTAFFRWAASAGLVLILATLAALAFVNFGGAEQYEHWRETNAGISFGGFTLSLTLEAWINDGLMALFFLVVGIEIKRELVDGELSSFERAAMPLLAALGGMVLPALIYIAINLGEPTAHGWGVPMATDIAFTLGILALLGDRVPTSLKVFVSALAIADDLGAILVIAIFYGHGFHMNALIVAGVIFAIMMMLNYGRVYQRTPYLILGVLLWYFVHDSGLHATLAGVLTAAAIPSRRSADIKGAALQAGKVYQYELRTPDQPVSHAAVSMLSSIVDRLRDPGFHLQHALEKWNNFLILPLFAFFNTGILFHGAGFSFARPEVTGTVMGLLVGKSVGIIGTVYFANRLGIAKLSSEISWRQLFGASALCGIGFTMSIFIASEAFDGTYLQAVKLSVLFASSCAAIIGVLVLMWRPRPRK